MEISLTFDVEQDLHSETYLSLEKGIPKLLNILNKYQVKTTFFVPANLLASFPAYFQELDNQGHEIAIHGYEHERFDDLSYQETEKRIIKSVEIYKNIFGKLPKGFRAPQHSIDKKTLHLLNKYNFKYDSSFAPLNLLQLFFFPKRLFLWSKLFFSKVNKHKLKNNLTELPPSSLLIPFVSLTLRMFPKKLLSFYLRTLNLFYKNSTFYAHSWDLINLPKSRIDRTFPHERLLNNLDFIIKYSKQKNHTFKKLEELC